MRRLTTMLREVRWSEQARRLARWQNPVVASPAAPLESVAALDALGPSLMPRTSRLQGVSMGLSVLGARATTGVVEKLTRLAAGGTRGRRGAVAAAADIHAAARRDGVVGVLVYITLYQQFENIVLSPRITARTMSLHPAVAFGAVIAGGAILGPIGALLALPAAASVQSLVSIYTRRYEVVASPDRASTPPG